MNMTDQTYQFICDFVKENKYPPTVREICASLGFDSTSTASYHLKKLEKMGKIRRTGNKNRAIELVEDAEPPIPSVNLPLLGTIAAGQPILAEENLNDKIVVSQGLFVGNNPFVLKVKGDSMVNVGIYDGDLVIISQQSVANNGEIVACLIDNEATVKRYYKENGYFRLQPENTFMRPIITDHLQILGKVVGLIRTKF